MTGKPAALYALTFPNGKRYIGISTDPKKRFQLHKDHARRGSQHLVHRAMRKFGIDSVKPQTLVIGPRDYILDLERKAIAAFGTQDPAKGYNLSAGGEANPMDSPGAKEKMRKALTGRKNPPEVRAKKQAAWTPKRRAAMAALHTGKTISQAHKDAVRAAAAKRPKKVFVPKTPEEIRQIWSAATTRRYARARASWMPEKEARLHWENEFITAGDALKKMSGWTRRAAKKAFGKRGQPKRFSEDVHADILVRLSLEEPINSISRVTGVSWTHINRIAKKAIKDGA